MNFIQQLIEMILNFFKDKTIVETHPVMAPNIGYAPYQGVPSGNKKIEPKLIQELRNRLEGNALYQDALNKRDARTIFRLAGECLVGVREVGGNNRGPIVELLQDTIGSAQAEAWCMSYVQSCIAFAEHVTSIQSPIFASEHCLTTWNKTPKEQRVKYHPQAGAIAIWQHGSSTSGHTGIVLSADESEFFAVEGNTTDGLTATGAVVRDGGGVYRTRRNIKGTGSMKIVGFLIPFKA